MMEIHFCQIKMKYILKMTMKLKKMAVKNMEKKKRKMGKSKVSY